VAHPAVGQGVGAPVVALEQAPEGVVVARPGPVDRLLVVDCSLRAMRGYRRVFEALIHDAGRGHSARRGPGAASRPGRLRPSPPGRRLLAMLSRRRDPVSAPAAIRDLLADVRRRLRALAAIRAALYLASAAIFLAVAAPLLASGSGSARAAAWIAGAAAALALVSAVALGLWAPARRWRDDRRVARWVGRRVPPLASDLLSSVELAEPPAQPAASPPRGD